MIGSSLPARIALAAGPIVFAALFLFRSVRPVVDTTLLGIGLALVVVTGLLLTGRRGAAVAYLAFPIAVFTTPAAASFSFDLRGIDSTGWQVFAVAALVSLGLAVGTVATVLAPSTVGGRRVPVALAAGAVVGIAFIPAIRAVEPMPDFTGGLTDAEIAALPEIEMLNFAYDPLGIQVAEGEVFRARVTNPTDLPHTFTVEALDLEVYVPAGRWAVVELVGAVLGADPLTVICTVGDHLERGMQAVVART